MGRYALGLDSSTQSITAIVIDPRSGSIVYERSLTFDEACPAYGTTHGVLRNPADPREVHSPPAMWAEALDLLLAAMVDDGVETGEIGAISGSGQQHGSVYLAVGGIDALARLDPDLPIAGQLEPWFSRATSPIWMDSSTTRECGEIHEALGGPLRVAERTGSIAFERFTGPQIRRFAREEPDAYARTERIHLVSSFLCSLLTGGDAPIDPGDGAGMNLMDIRARDWDVEAVAATAPDLGARLPRIAPSDSIAGEISARYRMRYGFATGTPVVTWSGDNPNSLVGVGLVRPGSIAISLGTSDTLFGFMPELRTDPRGEGHVFGSPTGEYMSLICFKNGSLARERVRDANGMDWAAFSTALESTAPGNDGRILIPWFEPEIVPKALEPGARGYGVEPGDGPAAVRAVVEAQMMSMRLHSRWMGVDTDTIHATGGASANRQILQVMADVHGARVLPLEVGNSAALGAAMRAARWIDGRDAALIRSWKELTAAFAAPDPAAAVTPRPETRAIYDDLVEVYAECERYALGVDGNSGDPDAARAAFVQRLRSGAHRPGPGR